MNYYFKKCDKLLTNKKIKLINLELSIKQSRIQKIYRILKIQQ
jgi:hypothetical protein